MKVIYEKLDSGKHTEHTWDWKPGGFWYLLAQWSEAIPRPETIIETGNIWRTPEHDEVAASFKCVTVRIL